MSHAVVHVTCSRTGDSFQVRVPKEHEHDPIGWGDAPRVHWVDGKEVDPEKAKRFGRLLTSGLKGVTVADHRGRHHALEHGQYRLYVPPMVDLEKGVSTSSAPKAGQRWITVHPNGPDEKGVPVLISQNPDKSWSIIAGAGGKLAHLRLHKVEDDTPAKQAEWKAKGKARKDKKRTAEEERQAKQDADAKKVERDRKQMAEANLRMSEREFIHETRAKAGGVEPDLDMDKLKGLSEGARNRIVGDHHRRQLRQAVERQKAVAQQLVDNAAADEEARQEVERAVDERPELAEARAMATTLLELRAKEEEEARAARAAHKSRTPAGTTRETADLVSLEEVKKAEDPTAELTKLGGRDDAADGKLRLTLSASQELHRRSLQALADAKALAEAAEGKEVKLPPKVAAEVKELGDEERAAHLSMLAAQKFRRSEVLDYRSERLDEVAKIDGEAVAARQLTGSDILVGVAKAASAAKAMGLADTDTVPLSDTTLAEFHELLGAGKKLDAARAEFKAMNKAIDKGDYDRSRRAFDLKAQDVSGAVEQSIAEQLQRQYTERLRGVADQTSTAWMQAASSGHYDGLADASLGIAKTRYLDRQTVDALGVKNSAALTRWAMERDGHDPQVAREAIEEHHVDAVVKKAESAIAAADRWVPDFSATVTDAGSIEEAVARLDVHAKDLDAIQREVGASMGQLEATATLGQAFRDKVPDHLLVQAGDVGLEGTVQWMAAIGLHPEDYNVDYGKKTVAIPQSSWSKLVAKVDPETIATRERVDKIKSGGEDEDHWLPPGIVSRSKTSFTADVPVASRYFAPLNAGAADLDGELRSHVGARLAEGEPPEHVAHDLLSATMFDAVGEGRRQEYTDKVKALFPFHDAATGTIRKASDLREHFDGLASAWSAKSGKAPFQEQDLAVDDPNTVEAAFRSLAGAPHLKYAFTPVGELDHEGRSTIRDHFYKRMGIDESRSYQGRFDSELKELGEEPSKTGGTMAMFGGGGPSPEWEEWKRGAMALAHKYPREGKELGIRLLGDQPGRQSAGLSAEQRIKAEAAFADSGNVRAAAEAAGVPEDVAGKHLAPEVWEHRKANLEGWAQRSSTPWAQYVAMHGSVEQATQAMQDELKHEFIGKFTEQYGKVTGKPLRRGVEDVTNRERHVFATASPEQQAAYREQRAKDLAELQGRDPTGKYSDMGGAGQLLAEEAKEREQQTLMGQMQGGMFGAAPKQQAPKQATPGQGQRWSLGARAEGQLGSLMSKAGQGLKPGRPVDLFPGLSMSGSKIEQQRATKTFLANGGRLGGWLGTGSGKTLISFGAFTSAHAAGTSERGLFLAPVAVQDQFGEEAARFLEPGKYKFDTAAGKSHEQRVAMLKDPSLHMGVMTHQAFRETVVKMLADHHGRSVEQMAEDLKGADMETGAKWVRDAFDAHGITKKLFTYLDEAHGITSSDNNDPSLFAAVSKAVMHPMNSSSMLLGTATPVKNSEDELYSMAAVLDPKKYGDRAKFMGAFGRNMAQNPDAVRRELAHLTYSAKVDPENVGKIVSSNPEIVDGKKVAERPLHLTGDHETHVKRVEQLYTKARRARIKGTVDVEALRELSPKAFEGQPESEHAAIAKRLTVSLGMVRDAALRKAINGAPPEENVKLKRMADVIQHDLSKGEWRDSKTGKTETGKPSIVFTDRASEAKMIAEHLKSKGVRVAAYHGALSHDEREKIRRGYQPEGGAEASLDVIVATSAAEAGLNLQRAKAVHHYDVPQTQKSWTQRTGRAYRQKQRGDVDVHDWHTDHPFEQDARRRLRRKEGLASVFEDPLGSMDERGIAASYQRALAKKHEGVDWDTLGQQGVAAA